MRVNVLAFAVLRDRLGFGEKTIDVAAGATVADAARALFGAAPPRGIAFAVNQEYSDEARELHDGDELALLPPVAGGSAILRIQSDPIDVQVLISQVASPACGATLVFLGTAREVEDEELVSLEYEAYAPMATSFFAELAEEIRAAHAVEGIAIVHRVGSLALGDVSVAIVVASPHRGAGFDALRQAIERIKEKAPVWKKEVTRKRARWVREEELG